MSEDLLERLEAATGPDRELDAAIAAAVGAECGRREYVCEQSRSYEVHEEIARPYTASIDAALTLVPEDGFWRVGHDGEGPDPSMFRADVLSRSGWSHGVCVHALPAISLCIAALRARSIAP